MQVPEIAGENFSFILHVYDTVYSCISLVKASILLQNMTKPVTLLGSTGSIGTQVLDVIRRFPERFQVSALAAGKNLSRLADQVAEFRPEWVSIQDAEDIPQFKALLADRSTHFQGTLLAGSEGLKTLATLPDVDTVIVGLVGLIGLEPSLQALETGKKLLTANKETFVTGGHLIHPYLDRVLPIDSEHVAIHQCLKNEPRQALSKLYLTASGGPFRTLSREALEHVTVAQALKHPNWVMGRKITIDSATMMNKGLEIIEARWLFDVDYAQIQVVVHPESVIHSGVEWADGSVLMQLGAPDMHGPIQYAMTYPERLPNEAPDVKLDLFKRAQLNIEPPDLDRFPCIALAYEAGHLGSGATAVLNGADEVAVALFLDGKIGFMDIPRLLEKSLEGYQTLGISTSPTLDEIFELDAWARSFMNRACGSALCS